MNHVIDVKITVIKPVIDNTKLGLSVSVCKGQFTAHNRGNYLESVIKAVMNERMTIDFLHKVKQAVPEHNVPP